MLFDYCQRLMKSFVDKQCIMLNSRVDQYLRDMMDLCESTGCSTIESILSHHTLRVFNTDKYDFICKVRIRLNLSR
jgi:hypothetical protein